jgi:hypothetical protein
MEYQKEEDGPRRKTTLKNGQEASISSGTIAQISTSIRGNGRILYLHRGTCPTKISQDNVASFFPRPVGAGNGDGS